MQTPTKFSGVEKVETTLDLEDEYRRRFTKLAPYREEVWKILVRCFFQKFIPEGGAVLDLGAGWGEFIRNVKASSKFAIDLNPDSRYMLGDGVQFLHQDCATPWNIAEGSLQVIFTSNFFEHLPSKDHLRRTLHEARKALKPGGKIICMGPNIRLVPGAYWDFWDHYIPLTDQSLAEILELSGFRILRRIPAFLPYSMSQGQQAPLFLIPFYLKITPLWKIFGKQFLIVAENSVTTTENK